MVSEIAWRLLPTVKNLGLLVYPWVGRGGYSCVEDGGGEAGVMMLTRCILSSSFLQLVTCTVQCRCSGRKTVSRLTLSAPSASSRHTALVLHCLSSHSNNRFFFPLFLRPNPSSSPVCSRLLLSMGKGGMEGVQETHTCVCTDIGLEATEGLCLCSVSPAVSAPWTRWPANWSALCAVPVGLPDNSQ